MIKSVLHQSIRIAVLSTAIVLLPLACNNNDKSQPLSGSNWGTIPNHSAEKVVSSEVLDWTPATGRNAATHFYSPIAQHGKKSLTIFSKTPTFGIWNTKINVKPWSKYIFTGWIKTENLVNTGGEGAGFNLAGVDADYMGFSNDNNWTEVKLEFNTDDNDSFVLECLFNRGGRAAGKAWFDNMSLELISTEKISTAIIVDANNRATPMSEYIYGQFIEHMGKCIYGGIWAEMIDDRKFWYEPGHNNSAWEVTGEKALLQMDRNHSYTGDQTPVLLADKSRSISLKQSELGIRKDLNYEGHIILRSTGSLTKVVLRLVDETDEQLIDEAVILDIDDTYKKFPFSLSSQQFTQNASLEIIPEGNGKLWIGTVSLMPADNVEGFRADVLELLKGLDSPVYRWPGGNFVSGYDWKDGLGDRDKRPPRKNPAWSGVEHNDVGIHEFMTLCELLETEPYIAVNAGLGGAEEARKEVEYCNGDTRTPMGKWRAENGHPDPFNVIWWSVGNEMYGSWQLGHMSTDDFVKKHNAFAEAMKSVDEDIILVAVGNPGSWNEMMLRKSAHNMDYISEHFYKQDWHGGGLMTHVKQIPDAIRERAQLHRNYREEIPEIQGKDIQICMDEWNYWYGPHIYGELGTRYFLRDALGIAAGINEFSKNSDIIYMANYAQTVNVIGAIKTNNTHSVYASTGLALKMYREHFGTIPLKISGETRPFDVAATLTEDQTVVTVSIVNPTWSTQVFDLKIEGLEIGDEIISYVLTGPGDMAYNEPGSQEHVIVKGPKKQKSKGKYAVEPYSATIFQFQVI
jgi:alpha-L-arabinofuranosidase